MPQRVLILSATAGAGHVRAAQALEAALRGGAADGQVRHVDTLEYTNRVFRRVYASAYLKAVQRAPLVFGWLYDRTDRPWRSPALARAVNKLNTRPFARMVRRFDPDVAVCTHFLPGEILARLRLRGKLRCPVVVVVTDLDCHALWLARGVDHYCVALQETAEYLRQLGVSADAVHVTGIPIDPVFAQPLEQHQARTQLGLAIDQPTILLSTGGFGVGPTQFIINNLLQLARPAQLVAICGRNAALAEDLKAVPLNPRGQVTLHVVGYTDRMHDYMAAADLLVGKPGGLTTSEALACGLPLCIVNPIPGQEDRNADHLLEAGCAIRCNNLPALAWKVERLLADARRLRAMCLAARRMGRPAVAADIARVIEQITR